MALTVANELVDWSRNPVEVSEEKSTRSMTKDNACNRGSPSNNKGDSMGRMQAAATPQLKGPRWTGCHVCGGPHQRTDCPDRADRRMAQARLNSILTQDQILLLIEEVPNSNTLPSLNAL